MLWISVVHQKKKTKITLNKTKHPFLSEKRGKAPCLPMHVVLHLEASHVVTSHDIFNSTKLPVMIVFWVKIPTVALVISIRSFFVKTVFDQHQKTSKSGPIHTERAHGNSNANPLMLLACNVDGHSHSPMQVLFAHVARARPCGLGLKGSSLF